MDDGVLLPLNVVVSSNDDDPDELIIAEASAQWRENPYAESRDDAQGALILTTGHIQFATERLGAVLDMPFNVYESAEVTKQRDGRAMLVMHYRNGDTISFWTDRALALQVVSAVVEARQG